MKAVVIDDARAMRMLLSGMLKEVGFTEVGQAANGKEGLVYLTANKDTKLALVDWNMPEMNGIEMVEAARKDDSLKDICLMMVTTESEMKNVDEALSLGANEYVMKPFTKEIITDKLRLLGFTL
jgi:two-component system chemotaxis response regulator CheY